MSDQELREILKGVIEDLDGGRLLAPIRMIRRRLAPPLLAAAIGVGALGGAGCDGRSVGAAHDAGVHRDVATLQRDASARPDAEVTVTPDAEVQADGGTIHAYGGPFYVDAAVDGGAVEDYGVPPVEPDAGDVDAYMAPPVVVDGGISGALYAAPGFDPEDPEPEPKP